MMDSGLGPFSASSLRRGDVLKCEFLLHGQFFILPAPSVTGMLWLEPLAGENQGKVRAAQPFPYPGLPGFQFPSGEGPYFCYSSFITDIPIESFLVAIDVPGQI